VPGRGGPGAPAFGGSVASPGVDADHDLTSAVARWVKQRVEQGVGPDRIIATKFVDNAASKGIALQRPLCSYPLIRALRGLRRPERRGQLHLREI